MSAPREDKAHDCGAIDGQGAQGSFLRLHTFHLEVMGLRYIEQVIALRHGQLVFLAVLIDECDPELLARFRRLDVAMPCGRGRGE